tara:strand:+ start:912 stop:1913 length:1002 start_codon:yes stop_codon:yes gene_type:complete
MVTPDEILTYARVTTLVLCIAGATYLDLKIRRVPNDWWISWSKPALFVLCLELWVLEADWTIWLTASAMVAYASTAVIGRPTIEDIRNGSPEDILVSGWYLVSFVGLIGGVMRHLTPLMDGLGFGSMVGCDYCSTAAEIDAAYLWGQMILIGAVLLFFEMCYQLRMLHGGADAKAMMFVALCMPNWGILPPADTALMPPALSLLIWGALVFLVLPIYVFVQNAISGDAGDLRMAWHARRLPLSSIPNRHVWLLDEVMEGPDGEKKIVTKMRPRRGSRSESNLEEILEELADLGAEKAWTTEKYPFMAFLMIGILPMLLLGDPVLVLLNLVGLP